MKNKTTIKEAFFIYLHVLLFIFVVFYSLINEIIVKTDFLAISAYKEFSMDICIGILSVLLTLLGLFLALPNTEYRRLMKKYNHDKIILNHIFCGSISSLIFIILSIINILNVVLPYLLIYSLLTVFPVAFFLFYAAKYINPD